MFYYLYYKLYKAAKQSSLRDTAEFTAAIYFGIIINCNVLVINGYLAKTDVLPFIYLNKNIAVFFALIGMILSCLFFLTRRRYKSILKKYSQESDRDRIKGNIIVLTYIIFSFLMMFAVAFYKPGKV